MRFDSAKMWPSFVRQILPISSSLFLIRNIFEWAKIRPFFVKPKQTKRTDSPHDKTDSIRENIPKRKHPSSPAYPGSDGEGSGP